MFIVLSHIKAQRANLQQAPYLVAATPVFASVMLGHAIAARLGTRDLGVGIIHHAASPHIERLTDKRDWASDHACQYRGATGEVASGGAGPTQNALQPSVTGDIEVSLILEVAHGFSLERVKRVIEGQRIRLAGGVVPRLPRILGADDLSEAVRKCGRGFWVSDATPVVQERLASGMPVVEAVLGQQAGGWYAPATLGYRALTRFEQRPGSRDNLDHAYGEALVGLVRFDSVFSFTQQDATQLPLWTHRWITPNSFIVHQGDAA